MPTHVSKLKLKVTHFQRKICTICIRDRLKHSSNRGMSRSRNSTKICMRMIRMRGSSSKSGNAVSSQLLIKPLTMSLLKTDMLGITTSTQRQMQVISNKDERKPQMMSSSGVLSALSRISTKIMMKAINTQRTRGRTRMENTTRSSTIQNF